MPACSEPPKRPARDVIDRLIDEVAWAKTLMIIAAATPPKSEERDNAIAQVERAALEARKKVTTLEVAGYQLPDQILIELRVCEMALPQLRAGAVLRTKEAP